MPKFKDLTYLNLPSIDAPNVLGDWQRDIPNNLISLYRNHEKIPLTREALGNDLSAFLKNNFFDDDEFVTFAKKYFHQGGLTHMLQVSLWDRISASSPIGCFSSQVDQNIRFDIIRDELFITESVTVKNYYDKPKLQIDGFLENYYEDDARAPLKANALYHVSKNSAGNWEAQVLDVRFDYRDALLQKELDSRSIIQKIKDWFSRIFSKQETAIPVITDPKFIIHESASDEKEGCAKLTYSNKSIDCLLPTEYTN